MSIMAFILIFIAVLVLSLLCHWLDNKYQWKLYDWCNGMCDNPFQGAKSIKENDTNLEALKQRVETIEAIVTEPAYELRQKINRL